MANYKDKAPEQVKLFMPESVQDIIKTLTDVSSSEEMENILNNFESKMNDGYGDQFKKTKFVKVVSEYNLYPDFKKTGKKLVLGKKSSV